MQKERERMRRSRSRGEGEGGREKGREHFFLIIGE